MLTTFAVDDRPLNKKIINVISLDFDGCLANHNYKKSKSPNKLTENNTALFTEIQQNITQNHIDAVVIMIGSTRQDFYLDEDHFLHGNATCFPVYKETTAKLQELIGDNIPCEMDGYLLADTFGKRNPGENFKEAITADSTYPFSTNPTEISKLPILYAQMHKRASKHADSTIIYDFYDDRSDIYSPLHAVFSSNTDLIPHNVALSIHDYSGNEVKLYNEIIYGTGPIQDNFEELVLLMYQLTNYIKVEEDAMKSNMIEHCNILSHLQNCSTYHLFESSPLEQFKKWVIIKNQIVQFDKSIDLATQIFVNQPGYSSFLSTLKKHQTQLTRDVKRMTSEKLLADDISQSDAMILIELTTNLLSSLCRVDVDDKNKKQLYAGIFEEYKIMHHERLDKSAYANLGKFFKATARLLANPLTDNSLIHLGISTSNKLAEKVTTTVSMVGSFVFFRPQQYIKQLLSLGETAENSDEYIRESEKGLK